MNVILQNVIFPVNMDPDVLPLYADPDTWTMVAHKPVKLTSLASIDNVLSRHSTKITSGKRVSYATYFNAFPASYWQRWTILKTVTLNINLSGTGTVIVYRSNAAGAQQKVSSKVVAGDNREFNFELPLNNFSDGGWYWFDLIANDQDLILNRASWQTTQASVKKGKISLGMCTFNKSDYCINTLKNIAADKNLTVVIDKILLVDQGTKKVQDEAEFPAVAKQLGSQLRVINQGNLGGSGGYSRAMAETLKLPDTDFLLLLDDDIEFETESALRALQFGRYSREPLIVGGHMFDLHDKPVLHAWAEAVDRKHFIWGPTFVEQHRHNFSVANLRLTPWMHSRLDAEYNGWWMCMIPKQVIADVGLSLPVFIKWDDAEYGLRAAQHGYRTVSMPGVALWHMSWLDKDDTQDWQAYFHTRNRIIAGLIHSPRPKGGRMLQNSYRQDLKKLLNMQYYAVQLSVNALRDVLAGPAHLHEGIDKAMPRARELAKKYSETKVWKPEDEKTPVAAQKRALPIVKTHEDYKKNTVRKATKYPKGPALAVFTLKNVVAHLMRDTSRDEHPEMEFAKIDALWWTVPNYSSVIVGSADGSGKMVYRHNKKHFRRLWIQSYLLTREIDKRWDTLAQQYREALTDITSPEAWQQTFESTQPQESEVKQ
ncbi:glycosyltransferase family 2 protein [Canibacter sp. lx-72]|uniref:glycosyltransferase n=1 Tax=Canibacter zhuwentaonis TaxID=2837491 RepID=UPI001BDDC1D2|nr:glycosyltransferase [Canibacter zhuwentaonis]MBT1018582.1 glycosyltransferase family 2 protein [Canibacter zhuwentaonis]MBT1035779.1 glycosyltransferase family 2 protein [Canibacter zhuwentaonis]